MKRKIMGWFFAVCISLCCTISAAALPRTLIPCGNTIGVKLFTKGLVVTGFEESSAAKAAGIKKGDVILKVDGETVQTAQELRSCLSREQIVLTVLRNGREAEFCVKPEHQELGAFVRDSVAGIGTVTYYDPDTGRFGALGHGVNDADTDLLLPIEAGVVVRSSVDTVQRGKKGEPGVMKGNFNVDEILGEVSVNSEHGIFGTLTVPFAGTPLPVAEAGEIKPGQASSLATVTGATGEDYDVEIVKIYPQSTETGRNLLLKVTDPTLLTTTGGIIQGMSGSPIIQDGKLIGAITHVLVNDPTRGYGIFIENMLEAAK